MDEHTLLELIARLRSTGKEWNTVDAKQELILEQQGDKAEFVKDVVAMANNAESSYLIIGLRDGTFADFGNLTRHYKTNDLNQLLDSRIDPPIIVDYREFAIGEVEYAVVEINGNNPPYVVAIDLVHNPTDRKRVRVYKGTILVRHNDSTEGISRSELEEILKKKGLRKAFENETELAQHLALGRPDKWQFLLVAELLKSKLAKTKQGFNDLKRGLVYRKTTPLKASDYFDWSRAKGNDLTLLLKLLSTATTEDLCSLLGLENKSEDPIQIKDAVDKIAVACNELLAWEIDLRSVSPPNSLVRLKTLMEGWAYLLFDAIENIPAQIEEIFKDPEVSGLHTVRIVFPSLNISEYLAEIERLKQHPEEWRT